MLAQSFHAQVSNAMTVAVNQENERSPISVSGQLRSARVNSEKRLLQTAFFLKAVFLSGRCGRRPRPRKRLRLTRQARVKGFASRGLQPFAPKKNQTISNNG
jgi:hypothetical protein